MDGVDLVIEVVPERVELKRAVFTQLDQLCRPETIIATNSSSIRVSLLEDATTRPEQVANLHFYLPVWDNPMVEIGGGTAHNGRHARRTDRVRPAHRHAAAARAQGKHRLYLQPGLARHQEGNAQGRR